MTEPAYATVEQVAEALDVSTSGHSVSRLRRLVHSSSRLIDQRMHRHFYPLTATYSYHLGGGGEGFWLNRDLLSLTAVTADSAAVTISTVTLSPGEAPYSWISVSGIDIDVTGVWGYSNVSEVAGALDGALADTTGTSVDVTDSSLVGIGDLIIVDSERMVVTAKALKDTTANITANLTASAADNSVTVNDGTQVKVGETITAGAERMLVLNITSNTLTVERAVDGTILAAHSQPVDVYAPRTLTVERGAAGSTAATHSDAAVVTRNVPPGPITTLCIAEAVTTLTQETSAYGRVIGSGEGAQEARGAGLKEARDMADHYRRLRMAAI